VKLGDTIKIHIPGETPWASVVEIISPEVLKVSLRNHVGAEMVKTFNAAEDGDGLRIKPLHDMKYGDEVMVYWRPEWKMFSSERKLNG
jgi:hypothetical protein